MIAAGRTEPVLQNGSCWPDPILVNLPTKFEFLQPMLRLVSLHSETAVLAVRIRAGGRLDSTLGDTPFFRAIS